MMKLSKLYVIALLAGTLGVVGCSDDPPAGTGGTGGGGTGGGGTGGTGGGVAEPCTEGLCVADSEPETLCEAAIVFCNEQSAPTPAQCNEFGNVFCELDFGGAGGAGGDGGAGGTGVPDAGEVCEFCETENQTAIDSCVDAYDQCQDSLEECVVSALAACRTGTVVVFVTDELFDGNLGGLIGADDKCNEAASGASIGGSFTAWISDNDSDARDRIRDGQYELLSGQGVIANDKADLTDGSLDAAIDRTESRRQVEPGGESTVWTATDTNGEEAQSGRCVDWTSDSPENTAQIGESTATDGTWTDVGGGNNCNQGNRLYCFADGTLEGN